MSGGLPGAPPHGDRPRQGRRTRRIALIVFALAAALPFLVVALSVLGNYAGTLALSPIGLKNGAVEKPYAAAEFTVLQSGGRSVRLADLRGDAVLVFFGYTNCPDVCPLTMSMLARARQQLAPGDAERVRVIFVTVDPDRDTPERMSQYAGQFDPAFIGAVAPAGELRSLTAAYSVGFKRENGATPASYTFSHSAFTTVIDPSGMVRAVIQPGSDPASIALLIAGLLRETGPATG